MISDDKLEQVCQATRENAPTGIRTTILDVFEEEDRINLPELYIENKGVSEPDAGKA